MPDIQHSPANGKTIGSLFAGIGGFDLGFERAGFKTTWACEIDQKAQAVLRLRFPDAKLHDDVCAVGSHNLEPVDVVTFGSPCQDLSVAGKRAGLAGERSGLFHEAARVIRELRAAHGKPDFAIWENVPGAFSSNGGRDFAAVVQAMVDLGARDVAWRVLDSRFFGVAQRRRRVFLVADFGGERAEQVLALTEGVRGYSSKGRQARQGSAPGAGYSPATSGAVTSKWAKGGGPADDEHYNLVAHGFYANGGSHGMGDNREVSPAIKIGSGLGIPSPFAVAFNIFPGRPTAESAAKRHAIPTDISHAISVTEHERSTDRGTRIVESYVVRRLTPVECCRLQGFPDDWNSEGIDAKGKRFSMADAPRYRQLGNAVTVNVANWIANNLVKAYEVAE
jgi:DNA (cytosine-5)-methyltransferase 1